MHIIERLLAINLSGKKTSHYEIPNCRCVLLSIMCNDNIIKQKEHSSVFMNDNICLYMTNWTMIKSNYVGSIAPSCTISYQHIGSITQKMSLNDMSQVFIKRKMGMSGSTQMKMVENKNKNKRHYGIFAWCCPHDSLYKTLMFIEACYHYFSSVMMYNEVVVVAGT